MGQEVQDLQLLVQHFRSGHCSLMEKKIDQVILSEISARGHSCYCAVPYPSSFSKLTAIASSAGSNLQIQLLPVTHPFLWLRFQSPAGVDSIQRGLQPQHLLDDALVLTDEKAPHSSCSG